MNKKSIGTTLRRLRNQLGLSTDEVGALVGKSGVTISGYESAQRQPSAEMFLKLCDIYKVDDIMETFFDRTTSMNLSSHEKELVRAYRKTADHQHSIDCLLGIDNDTVSEATEDVSEDLNKKRA